MWIDRYSNCYRDGEMAPTQRKINIPRFGGLRKRCHG